MKKRFFFIIISLFSVLSCTGRRDAGNSGYNVIDIESSVGKGRVVDLSEIATEIRYIPLETNKNSAIGSTPVISYEKGRIYIRSSGIMKVFDSLGRYLYTFDKRGRGAHEYYYSRPFVEYLNGGFSVAEKLRDCTVVKIYSRDGEYVKSVVVPNPNNNLIHSVTILNPNLFVAQIRSTPFNFEKNNIALFFDSLSNFLGFLPKPKLKIDNKKKSVTTLFLGSKKVSFDEDNIPVFYRTFGDKIRIYTNTGDTIYGCGSDLKLKTEFVLNYGKYKKENYIPVDFTNFPGDFINISNLYYLENASFLVLDVNLRDFAHEPYFGSISIFVPNAKKTSSFGLYNKSTREFTFLNHPLKGKPGFRENILNGPPFIPVYFSNDNYAAGIMYPQTLLNYASEYNVSDSLKEVVAGLKEADNPVIVIAKLK